MAQPKQNAANAAGKPGERALSEHIGRRSAKLTGRDLSVGIGDDCAILRPRAGEEFLVTTDFSLEGRHFRRDWHPPASIGHRALARGLSDIAAMGGRPVAAFLSLALPQAVAADRPWLDAFLDGMLALAADHRIPLAGGDTSESPSDAVLLDIVLMGTAPAGKSLRRSTARAGDNLYCTGSLGGSARELSQLERKPDLYRETKRERPQPHLYPEPRIAQGIALRERGLATACIDLSDGLSTDLAHLCTASRVAAEVDFLALPIAPGLKTTDARVREHCALHGGEDYELLFTARPAAKVPKQILGVPITCIGNIVSARKGRPQLTLIDANGLRSELIPAGWEHLTG